MMVLTTSFHTEKWCHLISGHATSSLCPQYAAPYADCPLAMCLLFLIHNRVLYFFASSDLPPMLCTCSVHSQQKRQIAQRLVLGALNVAYQQSDVRFQGPWPTGYMSSPSSSTLRLSFDAADLYVHNQHGYIGFEASRRLDSLPLQS